jgi:hypothetical protein
MRRRRWRGSKRGGQFNRNRSAINARAFSSKPLGPVVDGKISRVSEATCKDRCIMYPNRQRHWLTEIAGYPPGEYHRPLCRRVAANLDSPTILHINLVIEPRYSVLVVHPPMSRLPKRPCGVECHYALEGRGRGGSPCKWVSQRYDGS